MLVLTVLPFYGISVYTYVLLFVLIERTDEFQLVSFICRWKAIQFVVQGLLPALFTSAKHVACLEGETKSLLESCTAVPSYVVAELLDIPLLTHHLHSNLRTMELEAEEAVRKSQHPTAGQI